MDRHSFRDIWFALGGAMRRERREWQHTLAITQAIYNWGGPRGKGFHAKPLDDMYRKSFPTKAKPLGMPREELRERQRAALARVAARDARILESRHADTD